MFPAILVSLWTGLAWRGLDRPATGPSFRGALGPVVTFIAPSRRHAVPLEPPRPRRRLPPRPSRRLGHGLPRRADPGARPGLPAAVARRRRLPDRLSPGNGPREGGGAPLGGGRSLRLDQPLRRDPLGLALVLVLRALVDRLFASPAAAAFVPWTLFLTDFSFIFAANPAGALVDRPPPGKPAALALHVEPDRSRPLAGAGRPPRLERHPRGRRSRLALPGGGPGPRRPLLQGLPRRAPPPRARRRGPRCTGASAPRPVARVVGPCAVATLALVLGQGGRDGARPSSPRSTSSR